MAMTDEEVAAYLMWRKENPCEAALQDELNRYRTACESGKITGIQEITSRVAVLASRARCLHCSAGSGAARLREEAEVLTAVRGRLCQQVSGRTYAELASERVVRS
jgi:hypothetical protein